MIGTRQIRPDRVFRELSRAGGRTGASPRLAHMTVCRRQAAGQAGAIDAFLLARRTARTFLRSIALALLTMTANVAPVICEVNCREPTLRLELAVAASRKPAFDGCLGGDRRAADGLDGHVPDFLDTRMRRQYPGPSGHVLGTKTPEDRDCAGRASQIRPAGPYSTSRCKGGDFSAIGCSTWRRLQRVHGPDRPARRKTKWLFEVIDHPVLIAGFIRPVRPGMAHAGPCSRPSPGQASTDII